MDSRKIVNFLSPKASAQSMSAPPRYSERDERIGQSKNTAQDYKDSFLREKNAPGTSSSSASKKTDSDYRIKIQEHTERAVDAAHVGELTTMKRHLASAASYAKSINAAVPKLPAELEEKANFIGIVRELEAMTRRGVNLDQTEQSLIAINDLAGKTGRPGLVASSGFMTDPRWNASQGYAAKSSKSSKSKAAIVDASAIKSMLSRMQDYAKNQGMSRTDLLSDANKKFVAHCEKQGIVVDLQESARSEYLWAKDLNPRGVRRLAPY